MFDTVVERLRSTEGLLRQSERMAQLGTLTAGVAHELNNPAAAVKRGAAQLAESVEAYGNSQRALAGLALTSQQEDALNALLSEVAGAARTADEIDPLDRSDIEYELQSWLVERNVENAWQIGPDLVNAGFVRQKLDELEESFGTEAASPIAVLISRSASVSSLLEEIGQASGQTIDVAEGLDSTLLMLRGKLKQGIQVYREHDENVPAIQAFGSELN